MNRTNISSAAAAYLSVCLIAGCAEHETRAPHDANVRTARSFEAQAAMPIASPNDGPAGPNPQYQAWRHCGVGSWARYHQEYVQGSITHQIDTMYTLEALTLGSARVHMMMHSTMNGQLPRDWAQDQTIPAISSIAGYVDAGSTDIAAAGQTFHCRIIQLATPTESRTPITLFMNDQVPGGLVRLDLPIGDDIRRQILLNYEVKN